MIAGQHYAMKFESIDYHVTADTTGPVKQQQCLGSLVTKPK